MKPFRLLALLALLWGLPGCSLDTGSRALYVLVDVSGTYHRELPKAVNAVRWIVAESHPLDFLTVAKISNRSFSDREIVFSRLFPSRPSETESMKRSLKGVIDAFARTPASPWTDIRGALYQAGSTLAGKHARLKAVIIFSDLVEDHHGIDRSMQLPDLSGVHVLAVNVIKLRSDNRDPRRYFKRIERWRNALLKAGAAGFHLVSDPAELPEKLRELEAAA